MQGFPLKQRCRGSAGVEMSHIRVVWWFGGSVDSSHLKRELRKRSTSIRPTLLTPHSSLLSVLERQSTEAAFDFKTSSKQN
ncbi:hypothetical protein M5D96_009124 [Drosophila gunungcola]|uniref:Uncharacterized protein n=1 Tax=Drosophila gunungcola TaxID=103775 RepID=A0A9P9YJV3_9MUSC|nr:hypothetical protein M5D96_009124 [Drosophila gunungcola]